MVPTHAGGDSGQSAINPFMVDFVPCNIPESKGLAKCVVYEDNDAVIKSVVKGRSPNLRHVARTHRVDLDFVWERLREDPGLSVHYISTKLQIADILTKGSFTSSQWSKLCSLANITEKPCRVRNAAVSFSNGDLLQTDRVCLMPDLHQNSRNQILSTSLCNANCPARK